MGEWADIEALRVAWRSEAYMGRRVADLWRRAYASPADPLQGIELRWRELGAATRWIAEGVIEAAEGYREDLEGGADPEEIAHLIADAAAAWPGVAETFEIIAELPAWVASEPLEIVPEFGRIHPESVARARLYELARRLAEVYLAGMGSREGAEPDDRAAAAR